MDKQQKILLAIVAAVLAVALIVVGIIVGTRGNDVQDFVPPPFDETAVVGMSSLPSEEQGFQTFSVSEELSFGMCGNLIYKDGRVDVSFLSSGSNTVWVRVKLVDRKDKVLAESGLIRPGEYVQYLSLSTVPRDGSGFKVKIYTYEPETYYSKGSATAEVRIIKPTE